VFPVTPAMTNMCVSLSFLLLEATRPLHTERDKPAPSMRPIDMLHTVHA
jgi:hypothetical protein